MRHHFGSLKSFCFLSFKCNVNITKVLVSHVNALIRLCIFNFSDISTDGEGLIDWEVKTFIRKKKKKKVKISSSPHQITVTVWFAFQVEDTQQNWRYFGLNPEKKECLKYFKNSNFMMWQLRIFDKKRASELLFDVIIYK